MRVHREGRTTLTIIAITALILGYLAIRFIHLSYIVYPVLIIFVLVYLFVMYFYRYVQRPEITAQNGIIAPCDGKIVVIEDIDENEYFHEKRKQISIFMSPLDVHMNWYPIGGKVLLSKIEKGSHLVAWAPKSSTENERSTVIIETEKKDKILVRQIAGAVARRIVCYAKEGEYCNQNGHLGFIKLGSRVDIILPADAEIKVELNQKVTGTLTILANLK